METLLSFLSFAAQSRPAVSAQPHYSPGSRLLVVMVNPSGQLGRNWNQLRPPLGRSLKVLPERVT